MIEAELREAVKLACLRAGFTRDAVEAAMDRIDLRQKGPLDFYTNVAFKLHEEMKND